MTVASTTNRNNYIGNDATATYNYGYRIFAQGDLTVVVRVIATGVETTLTIATDYTVTGVGASAGGTIVLVNAAQAWLTGGFLRTTYALSIRREMDLTQETDIRNQGDFYPENHEDQFDKQTMVDQQQQDEIDRSLKLAESIDPATFDATIPATIVGAVSKTIITNAGGTAFIVGPSASEISGASASASAAAASAAAALASEVAAAAVGVDLVGHAADTSTHGIATAIVGTTETQTLTNKALSDSTTSIVDVTDATKKILFNAAGTAGTSTTITGSQTVNRVLTMPDATDTIVGKATTDTLTNKTFDADGTGNSITNIEDADIKAGAAIDASKIADGSVSSTEFQYISTLSSNAQTQITARALSTDLTTHESDTSTHGVGEIVGRTEVQTLTNKTLTSPVVNSPTGIVKGDVGLGNVDNTSNATERAAAATLTNKALSDTTTSIVDSVDATIKILFDAAGTAGTTTTLTSSQTTNKVLTLPNATDTLVGKATTDTLTNKTFDADGSGNSITNIENADIKAAAAIDASKIADGSVSSTEFQYISTLSSNAQTQISARALSTDLTTHESDTSTHGVGEIVGRTEVQTLTNKTLTSPVVNSPTGIVKGDVGLGNVDNTSNATERAATATLTSKTVVVASNTITTAASGNLVATELNAALAEIQGDLDTLNAGISPPSSYKITNLGIAATVAASALTIAIKTDSGSDASASDKIEIGFRDATAGTGQFSTGEITGALSTVISSGSTAGQVSGAASYIYVYLINNAGTVEVAWARTTFDEGSIVTTTAEGGAGAADSASTIYSTTARTGVAVRLVGRLLNTQATAGTWATNPAEISLTPFSPLLVAARGVNTAGTSVANNTEQVMVYDATKSYDTHNALVASTGIFTAPEAGYYSCAWQFQLASNAGWAAGEVCYSVLYKGGAVYASGNFLRIQATATSTLTSGGASTVLLAKGDTLSVAFFQNSGGAILLGTSAEQNHFSIQKINEG